MYFTPQQLSGGPKYSHGTRVGNWSEDFDLAGHSQKEYLDKKDKGKLLINLTQQKFAKAFQRVPHTFNEDGLLRFKDNVMLMNKQTNGFLVFDMDDKITSVDEAYACTATKDTVGPCGRSILYVESVADPTAASTKVHYGDQVRFVTNPYIFHKPLYLHSCQLTPQIYARFSRNAEVCLSAKANFNTVWRILPPDGPTSALIGQPVQANTEMWIEHCATRELLFNDAISYGNQFGRELEVSCKKMTVKHKPQQLENELVGKHVVNLSQKDIMQQNIWQILLAVDPAAAEPVAPPKALPYDGAELLAQVKAMLCERGAMSIRGVAQVFKIIDKNNNRQIDQSELDVGLRQMGINLVPEQVEALLKYFDKDGSGQVDLNEFMVAIRGDMNAARLSWVNAAYDKLDKNGDGRVTLDDIAKIVDISSLPEVVNGDKTAKEVYTQYMACWETQQADGIVTFEEFVDYYRDISASVDSDEMFAAIMKSAWGL